MFVIGFGFDIAAWFINDSFKFNLKFRVLQKATVLGNILLYIKQYSEWHNLIISLPSHLYHLRNFVVSYLHPYAHMSYLF